eukprot:TRINITY_DN908_c0_g1_i5.p1 TRINITY_DN908_c0_g1~~TRINITY_DN908_c0_g1_i5.p1  ORF type:complete len:1299 (+),score=340.56 TRINITY_DN908_c0_g1_i5:90-3986(+)
MAGSAAKPEPKDHDSFQDAMLPDDANVPYRRGAEGLGAEAAAAALQQLRDEALGALAAAATKPPAEAERGGFSPASPARLPGQPPAPAQEPPHPHLPPLISVTHAPTSGGSPSAHAGSAPALNPLVTGGLSPLPRLGSLLTPNFLASPYSSPRSAADFYGSGLSGLGGGGPLSGLGGGGAPARMGDGLEAGSYPVDGDTRADYLKDLMSKRTLHREDYPTREDWCPGILAWLIALPGLFAKKFTPAERAELGLTYKPRDPHPVEFHDQDVVQEAAERMPCGGCAPRTPLRWCGIHRAENLATCSRVTACLHAGESVGAATCLLDNFVRVSGRVIAALRGQRPAAGCAVISPEQAAALGRVRAKEAAEGLMALFAYSYEIKAPPGTPDCDDGSRPTQLYRVLGCALRSLGDPASRARLSKAPLKLWQRAVELLRPFSWRLDKILLALPHQPRVVYRGIDARVSDDYKVGSVVMWPPVTSTSASREVAWGFMSPDGSGTFFIILTLSVADIAAFSWLPDEGEWLLHTLSVHVVTDKVQPGIRAMVGTNHDIICLIQTDGRTGGLPPAEMVRARQLALREQTILFDDFLSTYVPPVVTVGRTLDGAGGAGGRRELLEVFREWCAGESRTAMLLGEGGSGKSSSSLRLVRAAADEGDPLPRPPGCTTPWVPVLITLPVVPRLLHPGTGEGSSVHPLTEHIAASNHLSPAELAEMQKLPLLIVLDGLEEVPEGLDQVRGRGLLAAGGLSLQDWPRAKVVLCIRREMLRQPRGCRRWHLTEHDVLPGGELWHIQDFGEREVEQFCGRVIRREMIGLARAGALAAPGAAEEVLHNGVAALRCPQPALDSARDLQSMARQLLAEGAPPKLAAEAAVDCTAAGDACRGEMGAATAAVLRRLRAADPAAVSCPFVLSMAVAVGQALAEADLSRGTRTAVYRAWLAAEVRRRLPRIADLADRCPEYAAADEGARVDLVLRFCGALACSDMMIDVIPSVLFIARLRRYAPAALVAHHKLSPLGVEHNRTLLDAAPLRVEEGDGALLSFPHASVQDHFAARRVEELAALGGASQQPDVQRVAFVLPRSASLRAAVGGALEGSGSNPIARLRRRITVFRCVQASVLGALLACCAALALISGTMLYRLAAAGLMFQVCVMYVVPRRKAAGWRSKLHYVLGGVAHLTLAVATGAGLVECEGAAMSWHERERWCVKYPLFLILLFVFVYTAFVIVSLEVQHVIAAIGGFSVFEWTSSTHRKVCIAAQASLAGHELIAAVFLPGNLLMRVVDGLAGLTFAVLLYCTLRAPYRVRQE